MNIANRFQSNFKIYLLAAILIVIGVSLVIHFGRGMFNAYRAMEFARQNNFDAGNPDPDLVRPWMDIRYIAVAFTVPQEFLFAELGIPMERRNSEIPLYRLNDEFKFGRSDQSDRPYPAIVDKVRDAIVKYRENPVPTGLREGGVRPWMSVQYISNSTGIPAEVIFEQIGLPMDDYAFMPLDRLSDEVHYHHGVRALVDKIQHVVDTYEAP